MRGAIIVLLLGALHHVFANFEYGEHKPGEVLALKLMGRINPFIPIYRQNMAHGRNDVEVQYTYVAVTTETMTLNKPRIIYDSSSNILTFFMRYPLHPVIYEIYGYSMPLLEYTGIPNSTIPSDDAENADEEENTTVQELTK